jgi:hypothetical protein
VENVKKPEWNFILPEILPLLSLAAGVGGGNDGFSLRDLVGAIDHETDIFLVTDYLAYYDTDVIRRRLCGTMERFPSIFFAVRTNSETLILKWIAYGADVSAIQENLEVTLLDFAIMNSEQLDTDTTLPVSTLLSLGAAPEVIPPWFYTPFTQDLSAHELVSKPHLSLCSHFGYFHPIISISALRPLPGLVSSMLYTHHRPTSMPAPFIIPLITLSLLIFSSSSPNCVAQVSALVISSMPPPDIANNNAQDPSVGGEKQ